MMETMPIETMLMETMPTITEATTWYGHAETPLGMVLLTGRDGALTGLYFEQHDHTPRCDPSWRLDEDCFDAARSQLGEYFAGRRSSFDVAVQLDGSPFQRAVWSALCTVGYGETATYGQIAELIGRPGSARAVGAANGRNPVSIIVPCHRIIGADASLTGYGWGVERKAWLLDLERAHRRPFGV